MTKSAKTVSKFVVFFVTDAQPDLEENRVRWFWKALIQGQICPECAALGASPEGVTMCPPHYEQHRKLLKGVRRGLQARGKRLEWDRKAEEAAEALP